MSEPTVVDPFRLPPYWHEDGDIHLVVESDNQVEHKFLVHRLMLCLQSPVFRDMFSLGENIAEKNSQISTVPMKGDSVEDVRELLKVIYLGLDTCLGPEPISFEGALGVLRLSHKYQMERLKSCILVLLRRRWPLDHTEYILTSNSLFGKQRDDRIGRSIKLINTARLTASPELLPTAFFELANEDWTHWRERTPDAGDESLSLQDLVRLMQGKAKWAVRLKTLENAGFYKDYKAYMWNKAGEQISIFQTRTQFDACRTHSSYQENVNYCRSAFDFLQRMVGRKILDGYSVVDSCTYSSFEMFKTGNACEGCARWMAHLIKNKEMEIWDNVTVDFDLPNVDEYILKDPKVLF